jgi:ABC-type methionine transport system ATPase subunit
VNPWSEPSVPLATVRENLQAASDPRDLAGYLSSLIRRLADRRGIRLLLVERDMNVVMGVCDRMVVLGAGTPAEIRAHPEVIDLGRTDPGGPGQ